MINTVDSDRNRSEFDRKNFTAAIEIFYSRIRSENSDFRLIDQLNIQIQTPPPISIRIFPMTIEPFYPRIRSKNSNLWLIDRLNISIYNALLVLQVVFCSFPSAIRKSAISSPFQMLFPTDIISKVDLCLAGFNLFHLMANGKWVFGPQFDSRRKV